MSLGKTFEGSFRLPTDVSEDHFNMLNKSLVCRKRGTETSQGSMYSKGVGRASEKSQQKHIVIPIRENSMAESEMTINSDHYQKFD